MEANYKHFQKGLYVFLSMNLMALAIILFLSANLGSDPLTIFEDGMSRICSITLGEASLAFNCVMIGLALIIARKNIGIVTIIYALLVGYVIDLWHPLQLLLLPLQTSSYWIRIILLILAQNLMCIGFALLIPLKLGMSCFDAVIYALQDKMKIPYSWIRIGFDASIMIVGYIWGAKVGFGTVFSICLTGYMIPFYVKIVSNYVMKKTVMQEIV